MKKVFTIVVAVALLATMGGVALAAIEVAPAEVNIVLPDGKTAMDIPKTVTFDTNVGTVDVWAGVSTVSGLVVLVDPVVVEDVDTTSATPLAPVTVGFTEDISIDTGTKFATVTFYYGDFSDKDPQTKIGEQKISVTEGDLDIKPGSYPNSINTKKKGVTSVAILGNSVDVGDIDVTTIKFGANLAGTEDVDWTRPCHALTDTVVLAEHTQDVNFDGVPDLVCHFITKDTGIAKGDTSASLYYDEDPTVGGVTESDSVRAHK